MTGDGPGVWSCLLRSQLRKAKEADAVIPKGEADGEGEADAFGAGEVDLAAVGADDAADDEEAEAGALGFGGEVGLEDVAHVIHGDAAAGVGEGDEDERLILGGGDAQDAFALHGLEGVFNDVVEGLLELPAVDLQQGEVGGELLLDEDFAVGDLGFQKGDGLFNKTVNILGARLEGGGADGAQELVDDGVQPGDLFFCDGDRLLQWGARFQRELAQAALHELEVDVQGV